MLNWVLLFPLAISKRTEVTRFLKHCSCVCKLVHQTHLVLKLCCIQWSSSDGCAVLCRPKGEGCSYAALILAAPRHRWSSCCYQWGPVNNVLVLRAGVESTVLPWVKRHLVNTKLSALLTALFSVSCVEPFSHFERKRKCSTEGKGWPYTLCSAKHKVCPVWGKRGREGKYSDTRCFLCPSLKFTWKISFSPVVFYLWCDI